MFQICTFYVRHLWCKSRNNQNIKILKMYFLFRNKILFKTVQNTVLNTFKKKFLNSVRNRYPPSLHTVTGFFFLNFRILTIFFFSIGSYDTGLEKTQRRINILSISFTWLVNVYLVPWRVFFFLNFFFVLLLFIGFSSRP